MKTVNLGTKDVQIKTSLDEVTIKNFEDLLTVSTSENYEDEIERRIDLIHMLTNLSIDDIENLDLEDFKKINSDVFMLGLEDGSTKKDIFEFEGKVYKTRNPIETFKLNIREIMLLKNQVKKGTVSYLSKLAAIIYSEVLEDGTLNKDGSPEVIDKKADIFGDNMTMNYISEYLLSISKYLNVNI